MSLPSLLETKLTTGVVGSEGVEITSTPVEENAKPTTPENIVSSESGKTLPGITALKIDETYFHSGWRPTFCWLSIITLFYYILIRPIANLGLAVAGLPTLESLDPTVLEVLLYSLTGFGIARSLDKKKKL